MLLAARALPTVASKQQEQCHISTTLLEACPAPTPLYTVLTILDITQPQYIIYTHSNAGSFVTAKTTAGPTAAGLLSIAVASQVAVAAVFVVAIEVVVSLSAVAAAAAAGCGVTATFTVRGQSMLGNALLKWLAVAPNCLCDEKIVAALAAHCERSASNGTLLL
eukprot:2819-Heterococcus_DN1.PRE.2